MPASPSKQFKLLPEQIQQLAPGRGVAICTDRITVDGCPVGYMYRAEPDGKHDSGWVLTAGDESEAYMDNASNLAFYKCEYRGQLSPRDYSFTRLAGRFGILSNRNRVRA